MAPPWTCNDRGREGQANPQGSARTTSAVDLEEFCEKHYEKLLPIMADKYEYGVREERKWREVKQGLAVSITIARLLCYKSKERRESTVFKRLGGRGRSTSAHSDSRQESSRYTENYSESEDSEGGHWKSKSRRKKFSV
ncbi:hypothetical protein Tco_0615402 [Tanacetum coccineum]